MINADEPIPASEIEAIRGRHEADDKVRQYLGFLDAPSALKAARAAHADRATLLRALDAMAEENAELKQCVIAFCGPHAARYGEELGLGKDTLHPQHYDLLERCGARLVDFKRGELPARAALKEPGQ